MNELYELIKNDKRLQGIKIDDDNLILLAHYLEELDNCASCKSLNDCKNKFKGKKPYYKDGEVIYKSCNFELKEKELNLVDVEFAQSHLRSANFGDFELKNEARIKALKYAEKFLNGEEEKGLFVLGVYAAGKTYFLSALANELSKKGVRSIFAFLPDLSRYLKNKMSDNSLESYVDKMKQVPVLFLDDLGGEMASQWFRDEILLPILQYRLVNHKPVFISSNLDYDAISKQYTFTGDDSIKADRLKERIKQLTKRVKL